MNIEVLMLVGYIIMLYGISYVASKYKKQSDSEGYFLGGRSFSPMLVAVMLTGIAIGGSSTVGVAENAYRVGLSAGWYNVAWAIGAVVAGLVVIKRYRQMEISTITGLFENFYGSNGRAIAVAGQLIIQVVITSLQVVAGGAILSAILPEVFTPQQGMIVSTVTFAGIALIGGIFAAGVSNIINVIVIYLGVTLAVITCTKNAGGMEQIVMNLPPSEHWFDLISGTGWVVIIANILVMICTTISLQGVVQVGFSAKDSQGAKKGFIIAGILILPIGFISAILGIIAAAQFPGINPTQALPQVILSLSPVMAGLVLAGLWAADVSTAVGMLLGSASLVIEDFWKKHINSELSGKKEMQLSRVVVLIMSVVTFLMASQVIEIVRTLTIGLSLLGSYTVVLLATIFLPGICRKSTAAWTVGIGIFLLALWTFVPSVQILPHPIYLTIPVAALTVGVVAVIDKRRIAAYEEAKSKGKAIQTV